MPSNDKLLRWFDLLAALLRRHYPVSFHDLAREVPAYAHTGEPSEALMRMFERDKDELRRLGIAIDTVSTGDDEGVQYRLKPTSFYLPYLVLAGVGDPTPTPTARIVPRGAIGLHSLPMLSLLPEEAVMLRRAATRVGDLEEPQLQRDAAQALRKVRHDLPDVVPAPEIPRPERTPFSVLADAIERRKQVTFTYHSIGRDETRERRVHPYGMVYLNGQWYLVGADAESGERRQFRTSRMTSAKVNGSRPQTPDFIVPADFDLRAHAKSRQAWELGTADAEDIEVRFVDRGGDVTAARRHAARILTEAAPAQEGEAPHSVLQYRVRRRDTFLRWLLSFAGDAEPVAPAEVVADWRRLLAETLAAHRRGAEVTA